MFEDFLYKNYNTTNHKNKIIKELINRIYGNYKTKKERIDNLEKQIDELEKLEITGKGKLIFHLHNPEGIEIGSIDDFNPVVYVSINGEYEDVYSGKYENINIQKNGNLVDVGRITCVSYFNGVNITKNFVLNAGETKNVVFNFDREEFDINQVFSFNKDYEDTEYSSYNTSISTSISHKMEWLDPPSDFSYINNYFTVNQPPEEESNNVTWNIKPSCSLSLSSYSINIENEFSATYGYTNQYYQCDMIAESKINIPEQPTLGSWIFQCTSNFNHGNNFEDYFESLISLDDTTSQYLYKLDDVYNNGYDYNYLDINSGILRIFPYLDGDYIDFEGNYSKTWYNPVTNMKLVTVPYDLTESGF